MNLTGNAKASEKLKGKINGLEAIHGYSAYEIAVIEGFRGTKKEWLDSLKGAPPVKGVDYWTPEEQQAVTDEARKIANAAAQTAVDAASAAETAAGHASGAATAANGAAKSANDAAASALQAKSSMQNEVNTAVSELRTAKENGEFDGKPGVGINQIFYNGVNDGRAHHIVMMSNGTLNDIFVPLPEKGTDYWTEEEQKAVTDAAVAAVLAEFPRWEGGSVY